MLDARLKTLKYMHRRHPACGALCHTTRRADWQHALYTLQQDLPTHSKAPRLSAACGAQALLGEQQTVALAQALAKSAACSDGPVRCASILDERHVLFGTGLSGRTRHCSAHAGVEGGGELLMQGQLSMPT